MVHFDLFCHPEYNFKLIFSKDSNHKMTNMISFLTLAGCDIRLENVGLFGMAVDLRVLYIFDFTNWINVDLPPIDTTDNTTSFTTQPDQTVSDAPLAPIPGLEYIGTLSLAQTRSNNVIIPRALYKHLWPVMAELYLTNLTAHKGKINKLKSTMPKLQDLNLLNVTILEVPDFPWYQNSLDLPRQLIRTAYFNAEYGRHILHIKPNVYLRSLSLTETYLGSLANVSFTGNLQKIDLSNSRILNIDQETFNRLTGLEWLIFKLNLLEELPSGVFFNLTSLRILDLSFNQLKSLDRQVFLGLKNLTHLILNNNDLAVIGQQMFCHLNNLAELDLSNNKIQSAASTAICKSLRNLTKIDLSNNELVHFPIWVFTTRSLKTINLNKNRLSFDALKYDFKIGDYEEIARASSSLVQIFRPLHEKQIFLQKNNFSSLSLNDKCECIKAILSILLSFFRLDISDNQIICNCQTYSLRQFFQKERFKIVKDFSQPRVLDYHYETWLCSEPDILRDQAIIDAPPPSFYCEKNISLCPTHCACHERAVDQSILVNCSNRGLSKLPTNIPNDTDTLYLDHNEITQIHKTKYFSKLKLLDLSFNALKTIPNDVVILLDTIVNVSLHDNEIQYLPNSFKKMKMSQLSLGNNLFICDCQSKWLVDWLITYKENITDVHEITCDSGKLRSQVIYKANKDEFICDFSIVVLRNIAICLSVFIVVLLLLIIIIYKFRGEIKVFFYFRFNFHPFDKPDDTDVTNKLYDAFVSYSKADVNWVLNSLCPALETEERPYRLCIHERDFEPGGLITDNILYSVKYSRRMIMILTRDFLKSYWCRLEFKSAHTRVLKDRTNYLIVILFDNISIDELDEDLKLYLRTNTFIDFKSKWFWQRLMYAMPKNPLLQLREDVFPSRGFKTTFPHPKSVERMQRQQNLKLQAKNEEPIEIILDDEVM